MLGFAWLTMRQALDALRNGRLEEAHRLLIQPGAQGHKGIGAMLGRLARAYVERGLRQLRLDDPEAAWRDLFQAEHLQTAVKGAHRLREALEKLGLAEIRALLQAGEVGRAEEAVLRLRERGIRTPDFQILADTTRGWVNARELADRGEFARALEAADQACRLLNCPDSRLEKFRDDLRRRQQNFAALLVRLHEALDGRRWRETVEVAEEVLALAPHHAEARKARAQAWKAVEPVTVAARPPARTEPDPAEAGPPSLPSRLVLWIDGVGGYLICTGNLITLGQAVSDGRVELPLVADVARLHASLVRDAEGYVLEAGRPTQVNGQTITRALLRNNDRITLGTSCQLQFRQPVPVSATARLDLVSGHRLPLALDSVLLMADTLVLGSGAHVHVTVPDLKQPIVLYRNKEGVGWRHAGFLNVNGQRAAERGMLGTCARVTGEDVAFALEPVGTRLGQT